MKLLQLTSNVLVSLAIVCTILAQAEAAQPQSGAPAKGPTRKVQFTLAGKWPEYVRGKVTCIRVAGNRAYVGLGGRLVIYQISPAGKLSHLGVCTVPGFVQDLTLDGRWAYLACGAEGLSVVDVNEPRQPVERGRCKGEIQFASKVSAAGSIACVLDANEAIQLIDITDKDSPELLSRIKSGGPAHSVFCKDSRVYIGTRGLEIWDIKAPAKPTRLGIWPLANGRLSPYVQVAGSLAYVGNGQHHMDIIDVSDPSHPKGLGGLGQHEFGNAHGIYLSDGFAYLASERLHIVDVTKTDKPEKVFLTLDDDYYTTISGEGQWLVAGGGSRIRVFDITRPGEPVPTDAAERGGLVMDVRLYGNYAYLADGAALQVLDIGNPEAPLPIARKTVPGFAESIFLAGRYAYVADSYCPDGPPTLGPKMTGLQIFDITDPQNPMQVNRESLVGHSHDAQVWVRGNRAYCLVHQTLLVVDITNPREVRVLPTKLPHTRYIGGSLFRQHLYLLSRDEGVDIFDLQDPDNFALTGTLKPPIGSAGYSCIEVQAPYAYAATRDGALQVLDVTDPAAPKPISRTPLNTSAQCMQSADNHLYITDVQGLSCYDLSDVHNPVLVGSYSIKGFQKKLRVRDNYVYIATSSELLILRRE